MFSLSNVNVPSGDKSDQNREYLVVPLVVLSTQITTSWIVEVGRNVNTGGGMMGGNGQIRCVLIKFAEL